jgi:transglycosylase, SLT family
MKAIKYIIPIILAVIVFMFFKLYGGELFANFNHPIRYEKYVDKYCKLYKVDRNLVYAIIKTESKFYPFAKSRTNSKGLMQISDETFEHAKKAIEIRTDDIYNKEENIKVGVWYLSYLFNRFKDERYVIIAYNAGPENIITWKQKGYLDTKKAYLDWNIPYIETRVYIDKVLKSKKYYENTK